MIFDDTELLADVLTAPLELVVTDVTLSGAGTTKAVRVVGKKKAKAAKPAKKAKAASKPAKRPKKGKPAKAAKTTKAPKKAARVGETKAGKKSTRPNALGKTGRGKGRTPVERRGEVGYGKAMARARKAKEWSGRVAAEKLGITQPALCNIERATVKASEKLKVRIKKVLGV